VATHTVWAAVYGSRLPKGRRLREWAHTVRGSSEGQREQFDVLSRRHRFVLPVASIHVKIAGGAGRGGLASRRGRRNIAANGNSDRDF